MVAFGAILIALAVAGLLIAYNIQRTPISTWSWLPPSREDRPELFEDFVSVHIGLIVAGCLLILVGLVT